MLTAAKNNISTLGNFVVSCETSGFIPSFVLRDEPTEREQINLSDYFSITCEKFSVRLKKFRNLSNVSNITEEKELVSLLETLISTKEMIRAKKEFDGNNDGRKNNAL